MVYIKQDLQNIQFVIVKGELEVQYVDWCVKYCLIGELCEVCIEIICDLNGVVGCLLIVWICYVGKGV